MKFDYQKVPSSNNPHDPWIPQPLIKIRLSHKDKTIQINALIDSGAAASLFHSSVATALGIDLTSGIKKEFFGISGQGIDVYFHLVNFQIVGSKEILETAIGFTTSNGVGALLGQADFFQHHQIKFERYKERFEVNPVKNKSAHWALLLSLVSLLYQTRTYFQNKVR